MVIEIYDEYTHVTVSREINDIHDVMNLMRDAIAGMSFSDDVIDDGVAGLFHERCSYDVEVTSDDICDE